MEKGRTQWRTRTIDFSPRTSAITNYTKCIFSSTVARKNCQGRRKFGVYVERKRFPVSRSISDHDGLSVPSIQHSLKQSFFRSALCSKTDREFLKLIGGRKRREPFRANRRNNRGIHLPPVSKAHHPIED